jgi:hypothetical protein
VDSDLVMALLGGVLCLFGFTLYMGGLRVLGFFLGGSVAGVIALVATYLAGTSRNTTLIVLVAAVVIGGALGYRFLKTLQRFVIFLIGAGLGYLLAKSVLPTLGPMWTETWVPIASALICGVAAFLLFRYIIILVTAGIGSYLLFQVTGHAWVMFLSFAAGLLVQIGAFRRLGLGKRIPSNQR